jgi:hypothetical protein
MDIFDHIIQNVDRNQQNILITTRVFQVEKIVSTFIIQLFEISISVQILFS